MCELAAWLEKNRPVIPDARLHRTASLRYILSKAIPSNADRPKLARQLAKVLAPVGDLYHFNPPLADAILKFAKRTLPRRT